MYVTLCVCVIRPSSPEKPEDLVPEDYSSDVAVIKPVSEPLFLFQQTHSPTIRDISLPLLCITLITHLLYSTATSVCTSLGYVK